MNEQNEDRLRGLKHVDPYGRISLGRKRALMSYACEEHFDGKIVLTPVVIFDKNKFKQWCRDHRRHEHEVEENRYVRIPPEVR